jgi:hypothetical protein
VLIGLHQDEDRLKESDSRKQMMDISLSILRHDTGNNEITHIETLDFTIAPNLQLEVTLQPGNYIILPRTTGCFFGRHVEKQNCSVTPIYNDYEKKLNPVFVATLKDIFRKFDMLLNRELKYNEFRGFWECVTGGNISNDEFKVKLLDKYNNSGTGLTEKGFINFFEDMYLNKGEVS